MTSKIVFILITTAAFGSLPKDPIQKTLEISKYLKPISDEQWRELAGPQTEETYEIQKGDTLYGISQRLFGDPSYWPKIWSLNNGKIRNPHLILPGNTVAFSAGSGSTLPSLSLQQSDIPTLAPSMSEVPSSKISRSSSGRSQEWKYLPQQSWEEVRLETPPNIDEHGFDQSNVVRFAPPKKFKQRSFISTTRMNSLGEITGSRTLNSALAIGDTVSIRAEIDLQIGERYTVSSEPERIEGWRSSRSGFSYLNLGTVRITGVAQDKYFGVIEDALNLISRGSILLPLQKPTKIPEPVPGPNPMEGVLLVDRRVSRENVTAGDLVFVDRGYEDGIETGMVFRAFQHFDPRTEEEITDLNILPDADLIVLQVTERISAALVLNTQNPISENRPLILLTDVSDIMRTSTLPEARIDVPPKDSNDLDRLEGLDDGSLSDKEKRELEQLEKWKGKPENQTETPIGESAPPPITEDENVPPPLESQVEEIEEPFTTEQQEKLEVETPAKKEEKNEEAVEPKAAPPAEGNPEVVEPEVEPGSLVEPIPDTPSDLEDEKLDEIPFWNE